MIHQTPAGKRIELLVAEVQRLDNALDNLDNQHGLVTIELNLNQEELANAKEKALEEAKDLIASSKARLDAVSVFKIEKPVRKKKVRGYWYTAWRTGKKSCTIYLGSCQNMDAQAALDKARRLKAEALGLEHCMPGLL